MSTTAIVGTGIAFVLILMAILALGYVVRSIGRPIGLKEIVLTYSATAA